MYPFEGARNGQAAQIDFISPCQARNRTRQLENTMTDQRRYIELNHRFLCQTLTFLPDLAKLLDLTRRMSALHTTLDELFLENCSR